MPGKDKDIFSLVSSFTSSRNFKKLPKKQQDAIKTTFTEETKADLTLLQLLNTKFGPSAKKQLSGKEALLLLERIKVNPEFKNLSKEAKTVVNKLIEMHKADSKPKPVDREVPITRHKPR